MAAAGTGSNLSSTILSTNSLSTKTSFSNYDETFFSSLICGKLSNLLSGENFSNFIDNL